MDNEWTGEADTILGCIKGSLEVSSQEFNVKPVGQNVCSSWGHIQGGERKRVGFNRLWFCQQVQATEEQTNDKNGRTSAD